MLPALSGITADVIPKHHRYRQNYNEVASLSKKAREGHAEFTYEERAACFDELRTITKKYYLGQEYKNEMWKLLSVFHRFEVSDLTAQPPAAADDDGVAVEGDGERQRGAVPGPGDLV